MNVLQKSSSQWFSEVGPMWPGQCLSLEVEKVVCEHRSDFQDILIFESKSYGRVLVLDGVIQLTERDEFSYQEMISHLPLCSHGNAENVLIIGGGDGAVLREVLRHSSVKKVTMCEIDADVPRLVKEYFPSLRDGFKDPRFTLECRDGAAFLQEHQSEFDVIIVDSSDPVGPAATLFEESFFSHLKSALRKGGIVCTQGESMWLHMDLLQKVAASCQKMFSSVQYAYASVPTYPSGIIGFFLLSQGVDCSQPASSSTLSNPDLCKYYDAAVHQASFVLPKFASDALRGVGAHE